MRPLFATLGIEIPIVQAPMGGAVPVRLAAAVSDAGALGTLPLWRADLETLRGTVRKMRSLTSKPFAVNLVTEFPQQERLEVCLEEGVPIISFFWRDPRQGWGRPRHVHRRQRRRCSARRRQRC